MRGSRRQLPSKLLMTLNPSSIPKSDIGFYLPYLNSMPPLGGPCGNIVITFVVEKLE